MFSLFPLLRFLALFCWILSFSREGETVVKSFVSLEAARDRIGVMWCRMQLNKNLCKIITRNYMKIWLVVFHFCISFLLVLNCVSFVSNFFATYIYRGSSPLRNSFCLVTTKFSFPIFFWKDEFFTQHLVVYPSLWHVPQGAE